MEEEESMEEEEPMEGEESIVKTTNTNCSGMNNSIG